MKRAEDYLNYYLKFGFELEETERGLYYRVPPHLGEGGFLIAGDISSYYVSIADVYLYKDIVTIESLEERFFSFSEYPSGDASYYKRKDEQYYIHHGLNFYVHSPVESGYMRIKGGQRMINTSIIYREPFFNGLSWDIPADFWETAMEVLNPDAICHPQISLVCEQLRTCRLTGDAFEMYVKGKVMEGFALTLDYIYTHSKKPPLRLSLEDRAELRQIEIILKKQLKNPPAIKELSKMAGINEQKLMKGFKQITGFPIYAYVKKMRMAEASKLLAETDWPVSQVAREVGYHGDGHFQKAFSAAYGMTPKIFRRVIRDI